MAVTQFPEFYPDEDGLLKVRCRLSEGVMTVAKTNLAHGTDYTYSFATECQGVDPNAGYFIGSKVVSDGVDSDGRLLVKKHAYNDSKKPIGEIVSKIDFIGVPTITTGTVQVGSYTPREATILFYGNRIRTLPVYMATASTNNLTAGMYLQHCTVTAYESYYEETTGPGTTVSRRVALAASTAATSPDTDNVPVLEGYEGV